MNARSVILCILIVTALPAAVLAQITVDQAAEIAADYKDATESLDMDPQQQVLVGTEAYWVVEIISFGNIITMVPIDVETGTVDDEMGMLDVVKTHYLANFFSTHSEVDDFLDDTKDLALGMKTDFETRKNQFVSLWEPQIPENVTFTKKDAYLSALDVGIAKAESLRTSVNTLKPILDTIQSPGDITLSQNSFNSLFLNEENFISALGSLDEKSTAFITEINEEMQAGNIDQSLGGALVQAVTMSTLVQNKNKLQDDLDENRNAINSFFNGIETQAEQYLLRLQNRTSGSDIEQWRKEIAERLVNYTEQYGEITDNIDSIPPEYDDDIDEVGDMLEEAQDYYIDGDYGTAEEKLGSVEDKIAMLKSKIGTWPPVCTGGKTWNGAECVCPSGTEEQPDGTCAAPGGVGINWLLVIGLLAILGGLVAYKKFKGGGGEVEESGDTGTYLGEYEKFKF